MTATPGDDCIAKLKQELADVKIRLAALEDRDIEARLAELVGFVKELDDLPDAIHDFAERLIELEADADYHAEANT